MGLQRSLSAAGRPTNLSEGSTVSSLLCQYASLLAAQGALNTAVSYLNSATKVRSLSCHSLFHWSHYWHIYEHCFVPMHNLIWWCDDVMMVTGWDGRATEQTVPCAWVCHWGRCTCNITTKHHRSCKAHLDASSAHLLSTSGMCRTLVYESSVVQNKNDLCDWLYQKFK